MYQNTNGLQANKKVTEDKGEASILHSSALVGLLLLTVSTFSTAQVVETSVTVNNNSPIQDYVHQDSDDHTQPTYDLF